MAGGSDPGGVQYGAEAQPNFPASPAIWLVSANLTVKELGPPWAACRDFRLRSTYLQLGWKDMVGLHKEVRCVPLPQFSDSPHAKTASL